MNNFERITASPEALGDFLGALPILSGPWDDDFHRVFCDSCDAENCDAENCAHQAERNSPTWWLKRAYTGSGPVKTDSTNPYKRQAADLRLEAMHQRDRDRQIRRADHTAQFPGHRAAGRRFPSSRRGLAPAGTGGNGGARQWLK